MGSSTVESESLVTEKSRRPAGSGVGVGTWNPH